ncbi:MAG: HDIG domain-containing protein [Thermoclostridium sp.]|nr:HDIG domain-containing protein [Thermoclostridium sp.]
MISDKNIFDAFQQHLMEDEKPSLFLKTMEEKGLFNSGFPFTLLGALKKTEQNPTHHPEGNVWNHTLLVVDNAALLREQSEDRAVFMWSALLHDIGKPSTTMFRKGKLTSYDHDKVGERLSEEFLTTFTQDESFVLKVSKMVRWHMQVLMIVKNLPFANISAMVKEVPLHEIALLGMCDRLGRGEVTQKMFDTEKRNMKHFLEKCMPYVKA